MRVQVTITKNAFRRIPFQIKANEQTMNAAAIYPNCANNMFQIDFFDKNNSAMVKVYNAFCFIIQSLSVNTGNTLNMDVTSFKTGVYFVFITINCANSLETTFPKGMEKVLIT